MSELDDFYKQHFGYDFSALPADERVKADTWLNVATAAKRGNEHALALVDLHGGLTPEQARKLSAYGAYKANLAPVSEKQAKLPPGSHKEHLKSWLDDQGSQFNAFATKTAPPKMSQDEFAKMSPEERAKMDKRVETAGGIQLYKNAGGAGHGTSHRDEAIALERMGKLDADEATAIARYNQFKQVTGGDPNWQGPINQNAGAPEPVDTPEIVDQRGAQLASLSGDARKDFAAENASAVNRSVEHQYDDLAQPRKPDETPTFRERQ